MTDTSDAPTFFGMAVHYIGPSNNGKVPECWAAGNLTLDVPHLRIQWARDCDDDRNNAWLARALNWEVYCCRATIARGGCAVENHETADAVVRRIVASAEQETRKFRDNICRAIVGTL